MHWKLNHAEHTPLHLALAEAEELPVIPGDPHPLRLDDTQWLSHWFPEQPPPKPVQKAAFRFYVCCYYCWGRRNRAKWREAVKIPPAAAAPIYPIIRSRWELDRLVRGPARRSEDPALFDRLRDEETTDPEDIRRHLPGKVFDKSQVWLKQVAIAYAKLQLQPQQIRSLVPSRSFTDEERRGRPFGSAKPAVP